MLPCRFAENSTSDLMHLEYHVDIEFSLLTPIPFVESKAMCLNNRPNDNIPANTEHCQEDLDSAVLPIDEVDECGGQIYAMSSHCDTNVSNLEENKYYPWANEHEFWLTEWLITKAKVSNKATNELLRYIHRQNGNIEKIQIRNVRDIKKCMAKASTYTQVWNLYIKMEFL